MGGEGEGFPYETPLQPVLLMTADGLNLRFRMFLSPLNKGCAQLLHSSLHYVQHCESACPVVRAVVLNDVLELAK